MRRKLAPFLLIIILFIFALLSSKNIGDFFYPGHEGWLGAQTGCGALNFIHHGFLKLKFCVTCSSLRPQVPSDPAEFYSGHPMLNYYLVALIWKMFGVSELSARLYMLLYSIGAAIFLFLLVRDLTKSNLAALFSTALYLTFPTIQFYGHQINGEISLLFFAIGASWFFYKYLIEPDNKKQFKLAAITGIFIFFGCMMDWFSYLFAATFAAIALIRFIRDKKGSGGFFIFVLAPLLASTLYILPVIAAKGSLDEIVGKFFFRAGSDHAPYPLIPFLQMNLNRIDKHFGSIFYCLFILSTLYLLYLPLKLAVFKKREPGDLYYVILFALPLTFFLLMKQLVDIHDFFMIYFAFFMAFAPVWIIYNFTRRFAKPLLILVLAPVVILAIVNDLRFPFTPTDNVDYVFIGKYIQRETGINDRILMKTGYPGQCHRDFYFRRYTKEDFSPDLRSIEEIIGRDKAFRLVILENRPDYYGAIIPMINKYKTIFLINDFIFDVTKPAGKLEVIKLIPQPTNLFWNYFISDRRPPVKEKLVNDPKMEEALYVMLGVKSPPINKFFPLGLSGIYYDNPHFSGNTKPFTGINDHISYIWTDRIGPEQAGNARYVLRPWAGFSLILQGKLYIPRSSEYSFSLQSDDDAAFYIDEKLIIDSHVNQPKTVKRFLESGWYQARLNFSDMGGAAELKLDITPAALP